jgi:hypothetical protein
MDAYQAITSAIEGLEDCSAMEVIGALELVKAELLLTVITAEDEDAEDEDAEGDGVVGE